MSLAPQTPPTAPPFCPFDGDLIENEREDWTLPWWWPTPSAPNYDDVTEET